MITLLLLHPLKQTPVQVWPFDQETVIRIGRSTDNDVILYSAVVSRHHVELRRTPNGWDIVNLGTNGTYVDGKRVTQAPATDGAVIRLARSGPNIQVRLGSDALTELPKNLISDQAPGRSSAPSDEPILVEGPDAAAQAADISQVATALPNLRESESAWQTIEGHRICKVLGQGDIGITYLAEVSGKPVVLKTLNASWVGNDTAGAALQMEADLLHQVQHPKIPRVLEQFWVKQQPYVVMEHIKGSSLAQHVMACGPVPLRQAIAWMVDLCQVLSHLHSFTPPVFHRNIEPVNLIHQESGGIALVGFGTVKALVLERIRAVGAAGFVSPGQLDFNACPQVDFYPIAVTLAYLLSGQNPLRFCDRHHNRYRLNPDAISQVQPPLRQVLHRLVQGHYRSADDVADALTALA
ncbi:MAG: FHA domain-containing protein [Elainellaceae cyanobacterium]